MTTSYKEIFDRFSLYFLAIIISPVLFGGLMAIYSTLFFEDSWSYGPTVLVVALYSFPFFLFGAFPISLYIDFSSRIKSVPDKIKAFLYTFSGGLAGLLGGIVFFNLYSIISVFFFGLVGGLTHFFVLVIIKKFIK